MVPAKAWYRKVPAADRKLGVLVLGFRGIVFSYPLNRMTVDVAPVVSVTSSPVCCDQCCGAIRTMGRSGMCTEFGMDISCVRPSSSSMRKLNVSRPTMLRPLAMPLHSVPLSYLYSVKCALFGDMHADANVLIPSRKETVSNQTELGSFAAMRPAKAR